MYKTYEVLFEVFDPETKDACRESRRLEADDKIHAINQILNEYQCEDRKVSCIERIKRV